MLRDLGALIAGLAINTVGILAFFIAYARIIPAETLARTGKIGAVVIIMAANVAGGFIASVLATRRNAFLLGIILGLVLVVTAVVGTTGGAIAEDFGELALIVALTTLGGGIGVAVRRKFEVTPKKAAKPAEKSRKKTGKKK